MAEPRVAAGTTANRRRRRRPPVFKTLEFYVISAQELRNVRRHGGRMKTYVEALVSPGEGRVYTHSDVQGGVNPVWNEKLSLQVEEKLLQHGSDAQLVFNIFAHGTLRDKLVGSITVLLADAVQEKDGNLFPITSHLVFTLDGDSQGMLNICVPPGGRLPKRLESMSFKKVHSDRGVQLEAFPSFKPKRPGDSDFDDDEEEQYTPKQKQQQQQQQQQQQHQFDPGDLSTMNATKNRAWSWRE